MLPRVRKTLNASWLVLAGLQSSKGNRYSVKTVKFTGEAGAEDQETDDEDFEKIVYPHYSKICKFSYLLKFICNSQN